MPRKLPADELEAAISVAKRLGLAPLAPSIVKLARHTTVRLAPYPVIARIQSAAAPDQAAASLAHELSIACYLAARHAPAVRPTHTIDPGPHHADSCVMTLWEFIPHRPPRGAADTRLAAHALAQFQQSLEGFDGHLPLFTATIDAAADLLASDALLTTLARADRAFMAQLHVRLRDALCQHSYAIRPLHGDAHLGNVLLTPGGAIWADLEAVCLGPREWDIAALPARVWSALAPFDADLARDLADLRSLTAAILCWADYGRSRAVNAAARYHLRSLKARFTRG